MRGRSPNRSKPKKLTITLPEQTHTYLIKLAAAGALGQNEALIAAQIVVDAIEELIKAGRAEKRP